MDGIKISDLIGTPMLWERGDYDAFDIISAGCIGEEKVYLFILFDIRGRRFDKKSKVLGQRLLLLISFFDHIDLVYL